MSTIVPIDFFNGSSSSCVDSLSVEALLEKSKNGFQAEILADSVNPTNDRLTTFLLTYPRCIHSEFMTHREFSRNSASSRAIPVIKMLTAIRDNPFVPLHWGCNQKGMQAYEVLNNVERNACVRTWMYGRILALQTAIELNNYGLHKQIVNRVVEPWMWITVIATSSNWRNFFALRCHHAAEPHINLLATLTRDTYNASTPKQLDWGEFHLPMITDEDREHFKENPQVLQRVSAGRCARVSYLTHDGQRSYDEDIRLYRQLAESKPMHASPLEHQAEAMRVPVTSDRRGNLRGSWLQFRKTHTGECVT